VRIGEVDADCLDANQRFPRFRRWFWHFAHFENFRPAIAGDYHSFHG
jgi:hypothetical protein